MTAPALACPECGGPMFDNRGDKRSPRAPDARCKDRDCPGRIWKVKETPPARAVTATDAPSVLTPRTAPASAPAGQGGEKMAACYLSSLRFVLDKVRPEYERAGLTMDPATVAATAATLFIQRCGRR